MAIKTVRRVIDPASQAADGCRVMWNSTFAEETPHEELRMLGISPDRG
jgi:hypothetical protein